MRALPSQLATLLYLRTPPAQKRIPPKLRSQIAAHTLFSCQKMHFFLKKFAYVQFLLYLCSAFR